MMAFAEPSLPSRIAVARTAPDHEAVQSFYRARKSQIYFHCTAVITAGQLLSLVLSTLVTARLRPTIFRLFSGGFAPTISKYCGLALDNSLAGFGFYPHLRALSFLDRLCLIRRELDALNT